MRLVLADDHRLLLEALATALADFGYTIEAAVSTPAEAVRAVDLHDPDVLLIDVSFPGATGLDAARRVRASHPRTKVVMITGTTDLAPLEEALRIGVEGYLRKARRVEEIAAVLETVAAGETSYDRDLLNERRRAEPHVPRQRGAVPELTPRETHVLRLLVDGLSTKEIVREMGVSQSTVRTHVQNIFAKLGVHSRLQAVALLDANGTIALAGGRRGART